MLLNLRFCADSIPSALTILLPLVAVYSIIPSAANFKDQERKLTSHYGTPVPGVRIELENIQAAMDKQARGEISTEQLADWATMLLLNDAYDWEGPKEEQIADWLNDISMLTLKSKAEADPGH